MNEATMTDADMKQREKIVKSMKKKFKDFRRRYGADAKNVMYATATKMAMKEAVKDEADKGEYDYEGDMAKSSLRTIIRNAQMMHDMLDENTNLPEWVASKVTLAEDYIVAATQYMQSEMNEEVELEEGSYNPEPARKSSNKRIVKKGKAGREKNAQQYMKNMMLPRSQRKSAPIKGTDKHGNRFAKHVSGPYMGEEVEIEEGKWNYPADMTKTKTTSQTGSTNAADNRARRKAFRKKTKAAAHKKLMSGMKEAVAQIDEYQKGLFNPPAGFTKKGMEKGGGVKTTYHYQGKSNTPSGATMKMGGVKVPLGKTPTKRRVKEELETVEESKLRKFVAGAMAAAALTGGATKAHAQNPATPQQQSSVSVSKDENETKKTVKKTSQSSPEQQTRSNK